MRTTHGSTERAFRTFYPSALGRRTLIEKM